APRPSRPEGPTRQTSLLPARLVAIPRFQLDLRKGHEALRLSRRLVNPPRAHRADRIRWTARTYLSRLPHRPGGIHTPARPGLSRGEYRDAGGFLARTH